MRVTPKTEAEIAQAGLLPLGAYDFEVTEATEDQSKAGNDMISLKVRVYDNEGAGRTIFDWLVSTDGGAFKVRHFAYGVGLLKQYETGELRAADMVGCTGKCRVVIKKSEGYPDKNAIADYLAPGSSGNGAAPGVRDPRPEPPPLDDDVPF